MIRTALLVAAVLSAAAGAQAAPAQIRVAVHGLDLSNAGDARTVYRHLVLAAAEVCGGAPTYGDLSAFAAYDDCYRATLRQAVQRLDAPLVTALSRGLRPVRLAKR